MHGREVWKEDEGAKKLQPIFKEHLHRRTGYTVYSKIFVVIHSTVKEQ